MDNLTPVSLKLNKKGNVNLSTEELDCYRGLCEHTHNFHLPYALFGNKFMYVCARCLGLYGGVIFWIFVLIAFPPILVMISSLNSIAIPFLCIILTLPFVLDWWLQCKGIRHSSNGSRFITGLLTSLSGVILILRCQLYIITIPSGIIWYLIITRFGIRWKKNRSPQWGCRACRGELPKAKPIFKYETM